MYTHVSMIMVPSVPPFLSAILLLLVGLGSGDQLQTVFPMYAVEFVGMERA